MLKVLVACEESQRVCSAFRRLGHEAYSCDIIEPSGGHPEWHIKGDVLEVLNPKDHLGDFEAPDQYISFKTMDGSYHEVEKWDLIIAHPPCTYISNAGACRLYPRKGQLDQERYQKGLKAKDFFLKLYNADCEHICVENPIPSKVFELPPYTQTIQPYVSCGTSHNKGNKDKAGVSRSGGAAKVRSKTFVGIANAIAEQFSEYLIT